jgi:hypothetical protein
VTLRKQKNKEMKRLKRALFSRDADATASLWRKEHGSKAAWRAAKQLRDTRSDPCPQIVRLRIRAADGTEVTESAGITTVFREHYKQLGSPLVCAEFDADNFDRVTAKVQDCVRTNAVRRTLHQEGDGTQSRTCRHTKLATLLTLKVSSSAGGSALVKLLLKLVNWVWELETLPTAWSQDR